MSNVKQRQGGVKTGESEFGGNGGGEEWRGGECTRRRTARLGKAEKWRGSEGVKPYLCLSAFGPWMHPHLIRGQLSAAAVAVLGWPSFPTPSFSSIVVKK